MSAAGVSPVTRSSASFVGSTGGFHSPLRQPKPRSQRPSGTDGAASATRATASSSEPAPSRRTSRRATDQVGKWTCASLNPGRTQRPPRSTRSGLGSAVSCVPTPPATSSPAIASARVTGRLGSIVRTIPFSRITAGNLASARKGQATAGGRLLAPRVVGHSAPQLDADAPVVGDEEDGVPPRLPLRLCRREEVLATASNEQCQARVAVAVRARSQLRDAEVCAAPYEEAPLDVEIPRAVDRRLRIHPQISRQPTS